MNLRSLHSSRRDETKMHIPTFLSLSFFAHEMGLVISHLHLPPHSTGLKELGDKKGLCELLRKVSPRSALLTALPTGASPCLQKPTFSDFGRTPQVPSSKPHVRDLAVPHCTIPCKIGFYKSAPSSSISFIHSMNIY